MAVAADRFLASLSSDQAAKARYEFSSDERVDWHFIPRPRKGLPIKELKPEQRALAFGLIESGLAGSGFLKATSIMSLEAILRELEQGRNGPTRDPELYFLTIFGTPERPGQVGLAGRGPSPLAQLHAGGRPDRRGDARVLRLQPGGGPPGTAAGPAHARRSRGPGLAAAPGARREPEEGGHLRRRGARRHPRRPHPAAADRRGRRHRLRRDEPRPAGDAPRPDRVVRRGHARRGLPRLARRGGPAPASTTSASPGPAPPTAARAMPTASRAPRSSSSSTTPRTAPTTSTRSGGTCWATSASPWPRSERTVRRVGETHRRKAPTPGGFHPPYKDPPTTMKDWTRREFLAASALAAAAQDAPKKPDTAGA